MSKTNQSSMFPEVPQKHALEPKCGKMPKRRWYYVSDAKNERMLVIDRNQSPGRFDCLDLADSRILLFNCYRGAYRAATAVGGKVRIYPYNVPKMQAWWTGRGPAW